MTCIASSRVGAKMRARICRRSFASLPCSAFPCTAAGSARLRSSSRAWMMGSPKASVFPEPYNQQCRLREVSSPQIFSRWHTMCRVA